MWGFVGFRISQNLGYLIRGPHNKDDGILGSGSKKDQPRGRRP